MKLPATWIEYLVGITFAFIFLFIISCLVGFGYLVYYLLTSPAVQKLLGY